MNKTVMTGYLGANPKNFRNDNAVELTMFDVAVRRAAKNSDPLWVHVKTYGKLATVCATILKSGAAVCVAGTIDLENYADKRGVQHSKIVLIADNVDFLSKSDGLSKSDDE